MRLGDDEVSVMICRCLFSIVLVSTSSFAQGLTLEQIMADPDWLGNGPESPYWADDSGSVFFRQKQAGSAERDLIEVNLRGEIVRTVAPEDLGAVTSPDGSYDSRRRQKVYARNGNLFLKRLPNGPIQQLTRTGTTESDPRFLHGDGKVSFRRGSTVYVRDLRTGLEYQPAELRTEKDPAAEEEKYDFLRDQQQRLFEVIRKNQEDEEAREERRRMLREADPSQMGLPWYLGDDVEIEEVSLGPREDYLVVRYTLKKEQKDGPREPMPNFVTESGYTSVRNVRARVGTSQEATDRLLVLDLEGREIHRLDMSVLPGIMEDPLKELREQAEEARAAAQRGEEAKAEETQQRDKSAARGVIVRGITWNESGTEVVFQARSHDNKDRWIARIHLDEGRVIPLYREQDEAWVNWRSFGGLEWLRDNRRFYFLSEETGHGHLYLLDIHTGMKRELTSGAYEVSNVTLSGDGRYLYYRANADHPGVYEIYRAHVDTGRIEQLTRLGGMNRYELSPNGERLLIQHSTVTHPTELYYQPARPGAEARRLTETVSAAFGEIAWARPEIVEVPSRHGGAPIYSRLYMPEGTASGPRPAVIFIHGAGYLQNAHAGWSTYFREFMFHSLLVEHGYVVLDMDYRASAGYGRDWRTAIYRRMGTPEVEDLADGVAYLAREHGVDPARVGCYGGSYGGFLTLMALFRQPELFACGAALRPVTDWAHYNHGYTSNILNVPLTDPEAYMSSSPIEFAEGLAKPLLICHGMLDDNVFFQDSVRLVQRLIELEKEDWEFAVYPVEPHGFREASSWLDEYRRIFKLFETHLK